MIVVDGLVKRFGGMQALDGCSLTIERGCVTGIIGPNGAGKTTLLDVICRQVTPDRGRVLFDGEDITRWPPRRAAQRGIARTFQIVHDLAGLTVLETLLLAAPGQIGETLIGALVRRRATRRQEQEHARDAYGLLERVGLARLADAPTSALSGGQKKLLDLARALMLKPKIVFLDEPAAGVAAPRLSELVAIIRELKRDGVTFALVEHDMFLVRELCDHVHVLAEGRRLISGSFDAVTADPRVVDAYLGVAA